MGDSDEELFRDAAEGGEHPDAKRLRQIRAQAARLFTEKLNGVSKAYTKQGYDPNTILQRIKESYDLWDKLVEAHNNYVSSPWVNYHDVAVNWLNQYRQRHADLCRMADRYGGAATFGGQDLYRNLDESQDVPLGTASAQAVGPLSTRVSQGDPLGAVGGTAVAAGGSHAAGGPSSAVSAGQGVSNEATRQEAGGNRAPPAHAGITVSKGAPVTSQPPPAHQQPPPAHQQSSSRLGSLFSPAPLSTASRVTYSYITPTTASNVQLHNAPTQYASVAQPQASQGNPMEAMMNMMLNFVASQNEQARQQMHEQCESMRDQMREQSEQSFRQLQLLVETLKPDRGEAATGGRQSSVRFRLDTSGPGGPPDPRTSTSCDLNRDTPPPTDDPFPCRLPRVSQSRLHRSMATSMQHSWIQNQTVMGAPKLPRMQIPTFDGDRRQWPSFIANFNKFVHEAMPGSELRIDYLRAVLSPDVQRRVEQHLYDPDHYELAFKELERIYGNPQDLVADRMASISSLKSFGNGDLKGLQEFSTELHANVAALTNAGFDRELDSRFVVVETVRKMPQQFREKWGRHQRKYADRLLTLADLDTWLRDIEEVRSQEARLFASKPEVAREAKEPTSKQKGAKKNTFNATSTVAEKKARDSGESPGTASKSPSCLLCSALESHKPEDCKAFKKMQVDERWKRVYDEEVCYCCLRTRHFASSCPVKKVCGKDGCERHHHQLLHGRKPATQTTTNVVATQHASTIRINVTRLPVAGQVLLMIVPVRLWSGGKSISTFAFLDGGSDASLIQESAASQLGLRGPKKRVIFNTWKTEDQEVDERVVSAVSFGIESLDGSYQARVKTAYVVDKLTVTDQAYAGGATLAKKWQHLESIDVPEVFGAKATVLIGQDMAAALLHLQHRLPPAGEKGPIAIKTVFGWCLVGPTDTEIPERCSSRRRKVRGNATSTDEARDSELSDSLTKFWDVESYGAKLMSPVIPEEDAKGLAIIKAGTRHVGDGYQVPLMLRRRKLKLSSGKFGARQQFKATERRFRKDRAYAEAYAITIREYLQSGHARRVTAEELRTESPLECYLPHHGVTNPNKPGKVRVVFNAAAKVNGTSLNDCLMKGPDLLTSQLGVFLRFRKDSVALSSDIKAMYHQVRVPEEEQAAFSFFWRDPCDAEAEIGTYRMTRHVFGAVSSPSSCIYALHRTADDNEEEFSDVAPCVRKNFYVDDYFESVDSVEAACERVKRLTKLLSRGGFHLTKWTSSSRTVLRTIPMEERSEPKLDLDLDQLPTERTLGTLWDAETDHFCFSIKINVATVTRDTKRRILSAISSIFDPLGLIAPVIFVAKVLMQEMWKEDTSWDEQPSDIIKVQWIRWCQQLNQLDAVRVPRCLKLPFHTPVGESYHVFSDASVAGYGAVMYKRTTYEGGRVHVACIIGKSRVAPVKFVSIPRKELQGAVIGLRLATEALQELGVTVKGNETVCFWTDSTLVLQWLNAKKRRFSIFVENRVAEILEGSDRVQWRHVPGKFNPADEASRGKQPGEFVKDAVWTRGPDFLKNPEEEWPASHVLPSAEESTEALEVVTCTTVTALFDDWPKAWINTAVVKKQRADGYVLDKLCERFSDCEQVIRSVAWINRLMNLLAARAKSRKTGEQFVAESHPLTAAELTRAEVDCARLHQQRWYAEERLDLLTKRQVGSKSKVLQLSPMMNNRMVIKIGGRLDAGTLPRGLKHPILLHPAARWTRMLLSQVHGKLHVGPEQMLADFRHRYWVPQARRIARSITLACVGCRRLFAKPVVPKMADLPEKRMQPFTPAFHHTGVDVFGPVSVTVRRRPEKRWVCLFTCLNTRAVHLEILHSMSTDSFLMALERFFSIYGTPSTITSDNGRNFIGGARAIGAACDVELERVQKKLAEKRIEWNFIPPSSPHFGGIWERMVKSCKLAMANALNRDHVNEEVLVTLVAQVKGMLNARPISHVSASPYDLEPITPNHMIYGRALIMTAPRKYQDIDVSLKHVRQVSTSVQRFWHRWVAEYLPNLMERSKWRVHQPNMKEGDVVLVVNDTAPRGQWLLGRVTKIHASKDDVVRSVRVKIGDNEYDRPVAKLCPLEEAINPLGGKLDARRTALERV